MKELTLKLTTMAHGGVALGRDDDGRPIFVPHAIPGETVRARITTEKKNFARAELVEILRPSDARVVARCPHFTVCGGCHFQQMAYETQLKVKQAVVSDQLERIGRIKGAPVRPTLANPEQWYYRFDVELSPVPGGGLGFWSPALRRVMPIETCYIIHTQLMNLWQDVDLQLPGLRKLTLRLGDDSEMLAALEVDDVEPPELTVDFPLSVAIVLPDQTAASLIGDHYLVRTVKGQSFRFSPGCYFQPSPAAAELIVDSVLATAALEGTETLVDAYSGVGLLTAFLSASADQVIGIEANPDAIQDASINLDDRDNVSLFLGYVEEILPMLEVEPDVVVVNPPSNGLSRDSVAAIRSVAPEQVIYVSSDVATLSRDAMQLKRSGYRLIEALPIDVTPQTFQIDTVSIWKRNG